MRMVLDHPHPAGTMRVAPGGRRKTNVPRTAQPAGGLDDNPRRLPT